MRLRLLLDEHISPTLVGRLAQIGVYAQSVPHVGLSGYSDAVIWQYALEHDFAVVTTNAQDFIELLDLELHPGLVVLRESSLSREEQWQRLEPMIQLAMRNAVEFLAIYVCPPPKSIWTATKLRGDRFLGCSFMSVHRLPYRQFASLQRALCLTLMLFLVLPLSAQSQSGANDSRVQKLYAEAKAAEAQGDPMGAVAKYEAILAIAPRLGAAYNNLGLLYFKQRQYAQAAAILEKGLKVEPSMPSASALLGISLYELGRYSEARPRLEEALHSNPKDANAKLFLANDLIKLEEFEAAATHLRELARTQPKDQETWYLLGKVYMQLSQQALAKMNAIDPNSPLVHEVSGEIMEAMKNFDGAVIEYKKAVEMAPQRVGAHYKLGNTYWQLSQWAAATEQFQAELANDANNCMAQWKIGNIMLAQNQPPEQAIAVIEKSLKICPDLAQAQVDWARAFIKLQRNEEALSDLQAAVKTNPEEPTIHFLLAQTYRALGRNQEAQAELQIFSKLDESARAATADRAQQVIQNKESH